MIKDTPFTSHGDEPVEARIVSWVLGEASAFEAAELGRVCNERPELMLFKRRMLALHGMIQESENHSDDAAWKLPTHKRDVIEELIGKETAVATLREREKRIRWSQRRAFLAVAACVLLTLVVLSVTFVEQTLNESAPVIVYAPLKSDAFENSEVPSSRNFDAQPMAMQKHKPKNQEMRLPQAPEEMSKERRERSDQSEKKESQLARNDADASNREGSGLDTLRDVRPRVAASAPPQATTSMSKVVTSASSANVATPVSDIATLPSVDFGDSSDFGKGWGDREGKNAALAAADENLDAFAYRQAVGQTSAGRAQDAAVGYNSFAYDQPSAELLASADAAWEMEVPAEGTVSNSLSDKSQIPLEGVKSEARAGDQRRLEIFKPNEKAKALIPVDDEITAAADPFSTFSLNVSDASFQIAQATMARGEQPDPAGIKVEQFYNAVDYGDPSPAEGQSVAAVIEQCAHPVIPGRNLVRVSLKTAAVGRAASQPLRLTLLVDQSGSMVREDRQEAMNQALEGLSKLLSNQDTVSVIGFSRTAHLLADGTPGDQTGKLTDLIHQEASEGGTNLEVAIQLGEQLALRHRTNGAQNRIVLFTDGAANLGDADPQRLAEKVATLRQKGIAFDIAGIAADDLNDELLAELARNGNGRYYVVGKGGDDDLAKKLAGAFRPAAENVKVQVRFNPERVARYKLLGFEKDRLKTEDFRNDGVDAAELAAEEAGVAIYQVEPLVNGHGEIGEVSVRFRDTQRQEMVERSWTLPYDAGAPALDRASPSMQLAGFALLAGQKLKGGELADAIDFKSFKAAQAQLKKSYGSDSRIRELLQMIELLK